MTSHYNQADTNLYHAIHSDVVGDLLHPPRAPPTPEPVRRFRRYHSPDLGVRTFHWGVANDPNDKPNEIHGIKFGTRSLVHDVVNPPVPPQPHRLLAAARQLTYNSSVRHPIGSVPLLQPAIPPHLATSGVTFGKPTKYGDTVAQCVSPFRTAAEFQANWCKGTDLYKRSHQHLMPGEQVHRCYGAPYQSSSKFGVPTPNDQTGRRVRECVTWPGPCQPLAPIVSLQAENWRELNQHRVGEPLDKFQCTRDLPAGFTHGTPMRHTLSNALDIATARTSCSLPAEDLARLDLILATRRRLQAAGFTSFIGLMHAMKGMDKLGTKHLPLESVLAACCRMCVPLSTAELRHLVEKLNLAQGPRQLVIYALFVATLNWKDRLTLGHLDLLRKDCRPVASCQTTSTCQLRPPPADWRVDKRRGLGPGEPPQVDAGPRRDRVVDVVRPTPFIEAGLRETELTKPRGEAFLMELMCGMGVCDYDQFKTLYAVAKAKNPPDPSVLDILDVANRSCCEPVEAPVAQPPAPEASERLCAGGVEGVKAMEDSKTCRGTDQFAFITPSLGGERKLRFKDFSLEDASTQLPKPAPGCRMDFPDSSTEPEQPSDGEDTSLCEQTAQPEPACANPSPHKSEGECQ